MDRAGMVLRAHHSGFAKSEDSAFDLESSNCNNINLPETSPTRSQAFATGCQLSENTAAYFSWPAHNRLTDAAEVRLLHFENLQKGVIPETHGRWPNGLHATTLLELMSVHFIANFYGALVLEQQFIFGLEGVYSLIYRLYLSLLPEKFTGSGSALPTVYLLLWRDLEVFWCDVDVVEFSYYGAPAASPKEHLCTKLVDGFGGSDPWIGSGSQEINFTIILCFSELLSNSAYVVELKV